MPFVCMCASVSDSCRFRLLITLHEVRWQPSGTSALGISALRQKGHLQCGRPPVCFRGFTWFCLSGPTQREAGLTGGTTQLATGREQQREHISDCLRSQVQQRAAG